MTHTHLFIIIFALALMGCNPKGAQRTASSVPDKVMAKPLQILVLTERGGQHGGFTDAAFKWLDAFVENHKLKYTEINSTDTINEAFLSDYSLIIQLDFPPYTWTDDAQQAFIQYIEEGRGGWVGLHHATLLGEFDNYPMWQWFSNFMGGIRFQNYVAALASATVNVEDKEHPVMKGVNPSFVVPDDEWYTFDHNPRANANIHVLASVDETTYTPDSDIKMGDHPAVWVNTGMKARNVYFLPGHAATLFDTPDFVTMFSNAILWAIEK
ncbi:MAG: ThuA domain-containing protein [Cytophagaceae bacterium]|jgi:type 1 glutamine amidotransferase|nr:ThuA domain-containing protein [Cytophagaceae bacterium]